MYTTCPDCSSVYEITPEEIAMAGGLVRCGNCDATFSAVRRLSTTAPAAAANIDDTSDEDAPNQSSLNFEHDAGRDDPGRDDPGHDDKSDSDKDQDDQEHDNKSHADLDQNDTEDGISERAPLEEALVSDQYVELDSQEFMDEEGEIFDELTEFATPPDEFIDADSADIDARPENEETDSLADESFEDIEDAPVSKDVLEKWSTEDGEHDLEALLADDEFMSDEFDDEPDQNNEHPDSEERDDSKEPDSADDKSDHDDADPDEDSEPDPDEAEADEDSEPDPDDADPDDDSEPDQDDAADEPDSHDDDASLNSQDILIENVDGQFDSQVNDAHDYEDISHYLKPSRSIGRRITEILLVLLLVAGLVAQYIHHERAKLATDPRFGDMMQNAYSTLGLELKPEWKVADYRIARHTIVPHQLEPQVLMARATIINNSPHDRPMPLLRLEIKNRWGDIVFARIFNAQEYLTQPPATELAGHGRIEAAVDFINPTDETEIGYSFDVCLSVAAGAVDCGEKEIFSR